MMPNSLRSGLAGGRLGPALLASLALHALLLFAPHWKPAPKPPAAPLSVRLPQPPGAPATALATRPPEPTPAAPPSAREILAAPAAVPPAPTFSRPPPPRPLVGKALDKALAALVREEFYPREAIARGLEGKVVLLLTLADNGTVAGVEIASSSGHALLDAAALKAAARIGALPGGRRQALLPVEFRLD